MTARCCVSFPTANCLPATRSHRTVGGLCTIAENKGARIWNLTADGPPTALDKRRSADDQIIHAGFLPGGRVITSSMEGLTAIWDAETGAEVATLPADMRAIYLMAAPAGDWIALVSSKGLLLWDSGRPARMRTLKHDKQVLSVAWSPGGELIATGCEDNIARIWQLANDNDPAALRGHAGAIRAARFSPDGAQLLTVSNDKTIRIWNGTAEGEVLPVEGKTRRLFQAIFSPDSRAIVGAAGTNPLDPSANGSLAAVWDAAAAHGCRPRTPEHRSTQSRSRRTASKSWSRTIACEHWISAKVRRPRFPAITGRSWPCLPTGSACSSADTAVRGMSGRSGRRP